MTFIIAVDQLTRHQLFGHEYLFAQVFILNILFDGDADSSSHVEGLIFLVSSAVDDRTLS